MAEAVEAAGPTNLPTFRPAGHLGSARDRPGDGSRRRRLPAVDALTAPGAGTSVSEAAEAPSIQRVLAHQAPGRRHQSKALWVTAWPRQPPPPAMGDHGGDPDVQLSPILAQPRPVSMEHVLRNAFGFGGQNAAMVLSG